MLIIGLTGGIGSGKTAASDLFEKFGINVVDADIVAREVVEPGTDALDKIRKHFGQNIMTPSDELDRRALRNIVFNNEEEKGWLEKLLHPLIRTEILRQLRETQSPYSILVSPLLFETNQHELVNRTLLIDVPEELQIERASRRDEANIDQIKAIINSQMARSEKRKRADDIIMNDSDFISLESAVESKHQMYLELANE